MTHYRPNLLLGLLLSATFSVLPANADVVNGSFENFFASWTTSGPNTATTSVAGVLPTDGARLAFLSNGSGSLPLFVQSFIVDTNLGLPAGSFSGAVSALYPNAGVGAVLFQNFTLNANQNALVFDWNFLTNEIAAGASGTARNNDFGFYSLWDSASNLVANGSVDVLSSTFASTPNGTPFADQTGWSPVSVSGLSPSGNYTLLFGVFQDGLSGVDSGLLVDNIRAVPEPSAGLLAGIALLPFLRRRSLRA
jgi:hypothetical protein